MGLMRFICPPDRITEETACKAYLSGYDRSPWKNGFRLGDGELVIERSVSDSGNFHILWPISDRGLVTLSTATLMERPKPYYLPLELARGKIGQIRNQLGEWQAIGLAISDEINELMADAVAFFAQAAVVEHGSKQSNRLSERAICEALKAADLLAASYAEQVIGVRKRGGQRLRSVLGADLGATAPEKSLAQQFLAAFNAANIPLSWRQIEPSQGHFNWEASDAQARWACGGMLRVFAGPLLRFAPQSLPDWLELYEGDFESLLDAVSEFIQAAVARYRGKVDVWQCAGRINGCDALSLSDEEKIRLVARTVELVRKTDPEAPVLVSFDQPWGEYLNRREMDFPPLHFADALVRANLGVSGLVLEINMGYYPGGSMTRDPLEFGRLLDHWSLLGVPLLAAISAPSDWGPDPLATREAAVTPEGWRAEGQAEWVTRLVPLLLAKPCVQGVLWNQLCDGEPHEFPHGGLFDPQAAAKPALARLAAIRKAHLE
jgi:hypothetical protein